VVWASGAGQVLQVPLSDDELAGLVRSAQTLTEAGRFSSVRRTRT